MKTKTIQSELKIGTVIYPLKFVVDYEVVLRHVSIIDIRLPRISLDLMNRIRSIIETGD